MWSTLSKINKKRDMMDMDEKVREIDAGKKGDRHPDFRYVL